MCHVCKPYKILFVISFRTIVMSSVGSQVIDFPLSKVWLLLLHPADDNRQLHFLTTRVEIPLTSVNFTTRSNGRKNKCPCPYNCCVETDKMVERHMYLCIYIYICVCVCVCVWVYYVYVCVYILDQFQNVTHFIFLTSNITIFLLSDDSR